jgi:predicted CXXCH cytochrome family protein
VINTGLTLAVLVAVLLGTPLFASALLSTAPGGQGEWYWQNPLPQGNSLYGATAVGQSRVWAVGDSGVVLRSTDGGAAWEVQDADTQVQLRAVDFADQSTGWVAGRDGTLRATTDGGSTWTAQASGTAEDLFGIGFADALAGWAVGAAGVIRATADGGSMWTAQTSGTSERLLGISVVDAQTAWAVGGGATILHTSTGGSVWALQTPPPGVVADLRGVDFVDADFGYAVGEGGTVLKTSNGGATWTVLTVGISADLSAVSFESTSSGWVVSESGDVLRTTDGGATWAAQDLATAAPLNAVVASGVGAGHVVGDAGVMRRTTDGGSTWLGHATATGSQLNAVSLPTTLVGWAVGDGGVLVRTENGQQWVAATSGTTNDLLGVDFVTPARGWAVGSAGTIVTTSDGVTWTGQASGTSQQVNAVDFIDADRGWYAADAGVLGVTTDGGSTWTVQMAPVDSATALRGISFADAMHGWAVGGTSGQPAAVVRTIDGGSTWATQTAPLPIGRALTAVSAIDSSTAWAVGEGGSAIMTADGGSTWEAVGLGVSAVLHDVDFFDAAHGLIVGAASGGSAVVLRTDDGGATWAAQHVGTSAALRSVALAGADEGVAVGLAGTVLRSADDAEPQTAMTMVPAVPDGRNGWYVTTPTVGFSADEPAVTYFSLGGAAGPWLSYTGPFELTGDAAVAYYSIDLGGNREATQTAAVRHDGTAPSTPTLLAGTVTSQTVTLTWNPSYDAVSGVSHYEILMNGSTVGTSAVAAVSIDLAPETQAAFAVRAYDRAGNASGPSGPVELFTLAATPRPPAVVFARVAYRSAVHLNWGETTGTAGPASYNVYRALEGGPYSRVATASADMAGSWVDASLAAPTNATYRVSVVDSRGEGPLSAEMASADVELTALPAPARLRAVSATGGVETSWTVLPGAVGGYVVYRALSSTAAPSVVATLGTTSHTDASVAPDTDYWYRVAAIDSIGTVGALGLPVFVHTRSEAASDSPHGDYEPLGEDCRQCHDTHDSDNEILLFAAAGDNEIPLCMTCHDGTTAPDVFDDFSDASMTSKHQVSVETTPTQLRCAQCHVPHNAPGGPQLNKLLRGGDGERSGDAICYSCHGEASDGAARGDLRAFELSGHRVGIAVSGDRAGVICLGCHSGHATKEPSLVPYSGDQRCVSCHSADYSLSGAADIAQSLSGADSRTRHDLKAADHASNGSRLSCANCHEPHISSPGTPTVDPDSPTTADAWTGTTTALCLRCHDDALPTSVETSGWAEAPLGPGGASSAADIASSWPGDVHGGGSGSPRHLRSGMGFAQGDSLSCESCHDSHGSQNRWALAESVGALGTSAKADGLAVVRVGSGADLRFFCGSCHEVGPSTHPGPSEGGADLRQWPIDCTAGGCHTHAGSGL